MAGLAADPRVPIWIRRAIISFAIGLGITFWKGWRLALTAAAIYAICDTVYHSKTVALIPAAARISSAQRKTKRRLYLVRPFGYMAIHARVVPGSESFIDHLVVGPGGVYAVDSERWDRRMPVRTLAAGNVAGASAPGGNAAHPAMLYHGPFSQKERLDHARWEANEAARLLTEDLGHEIVVRPAMVIYGPTVPWGVTNLRGVDVFAGRKVAKYFRSRKRANRMSALDWEEAGTILAAADRVLPRE
jgi:hypothetical protein